MSYIGTFEIAWNLLNAGELSSLIQVVLWTFIGFSELLQNLSQRLKSQVEMLRLLFFWVWCEINDLIDFVQIALCSIQKGISGQVDEECVKAWLNCVGSYWDLWWCCYYKWGGE